MSFEEHVIGMGEKRNACRILVGKPLGKTACTHVYMAGCY
jgi:hypothetical protein